MNRRRSFTMHPADSLPGGHLDVRKCSAEQVQAALATFGTHMTVSEADEWLQRRRKGI